MKRVIAAVLAVFLASPGCASLPRSRASLPIDPLAYARRQPPRAQAFAARDAASWQQYLSDLPVGSRVKVQTRDGASFKGTFMGVKGDAVTIAPRTRIPEAVRVVPVSSLVALELDQGPSVGKIIAISAAVAGATVLGTLLVLIASID